MHAEAQRIDHRLQPAEKQENGIVEDFLEGQPASAELLAHHLRDEVVTGRDEARAYRLGQDLADALDGGLPQPRIRRGSRILRELTELLQSIGGHAGDLEEKSRRQRLGDIVQKLAIPSVGDRRYEIDGQLTDRRLEG